MSVRKVFLAVLEEMGGEGSLVSVTRIRRWIETELWESDPSDPSAGKTGGAELILQPNGCEALFDEAVGPV